MVFVSASYLPVTLLFWQCRWGIPFIRACSVALARLGSERVVQRLRRLPVALWKGILLLVQVLLLHARGSFV